MNISTLLNHLSTKLQAVTDTPRLEVELLVAEGLKCSRAQLYVNSDQDLNTKQLDIINSLVKRRLAHEPIAYILGYKEFWSLPLKVTPDTLIPRPETEAVVEWVLQHFSANKTLKLADLGTGSGAIALALASEKPHWQITATDFSADSLGVAQHNAAQLAINSVEFRLGNWCEALDQHDYDVIVSNPPYIAENDPHLFALSYEPLKALVAKDSGLAEIKKIMNESRHHLKAGGLLILEHGFKQASLVQSLFQDYGYSSIQTHRDLNKQERFSLGAWRN